MVRNLEIKKKFLVYNLHLLLLCNEQLATVNQRLRKEKAKLECASHNHKYCHENWIGLWAGEVRHKRIRSVKQKMLPLSYHCSVTERGNITVVPQAIEVKSHALKVFSKQIIIFWKELYDRKVGDVEIAGIIQSPILNGKGQRAEQKG